ncbi:MAG: DsrE family protein [Dehalococcoidales bacterium]|nr:DsrE family protein [Dehalococcoidales bacterium]
MEENAPEKIVIFATHGGEDPEKATLPFVVGNAALAMDVAVTMVLQAEGVTAVQEGHYEDIAAAGFDRLKKLVSSFLEFGGKIIVCIPCLESRNIAADQLVEGTELAKGARIVQEVLEAKAVLNY